MSAICSLTAQRGGRAGVAATQPAAGRSATAARRGSIPVATPTSVTSAAVAKQPNATHVTPASLAMTGTGRFPTVASKAASRRSILTLTGNINTGRT